MTREARRPRERGAPRTLLWQPRKYRVPTTTRGQRDLALAGSIPPTALAGLLCVRGAVLKLISVLTKSDRQRPNRDERWT